MKLETLAFASLIAALVPVAVSAQGATGSARISGEASVRAQARGSDATPSPSTTSAQAGQQGGAAASGSGQAAASQQPGSADARINATLAAAAKAHLPAQLLESKVAEGRAKHVPEQRIASAVEARYQALLRASGVLGRASIGSASAGELAVAADALQAGVSENALIKLEKGAPPAQREVATATLAQLVQLGYGPDAALLRVNGALAQGEDALANLSAEAAAALRLGGGLGIKLP